MSFPQRRHRSHAHRRRGALVVLTTTLLGLGTAACGHATGAPGRPVARAAAGLSMATSIETSAGSWAVVPMGDLNDPLNTFWQLFFRPRGASNWSDLSSALAVATNGGLVLAARDGLSLTVGVRPANLLEFSPILVTSDGGRAWTPASPIAALAKQPDALAIGTGGSAVALTAASGGVEEVSESSGQLAGWNELTTSTELQSSPAGRACGLGSITAVGVQASTPIVGADCRRAGIVGVFSDAQGPWELAGPALPASLAAGNVDVLGLLPTTGGLCALLAVSDGHESGLLAAWRSNGDTRWRTSPVLAVGSGGVRSFGPDGRRGLFLVTSSADASESVEVIGGPGDAWDALPTPPPGTETLAFGPAGKVDALAARDTLFTDWVLAPGAGNWTRSQVANVPIQFGSSS